MINSKKRNHILEISFIVYGSIMIFYQLVPTIIIAFISLMFFIFAYMKLRHSYNLLETISILSIIGIPVSTISIIGGNHSSFPLTWHNFCILLLLFLIFSRGKIKKEYFIAIVPFAIFEVVQCFFTPSFFNAFKQYLMILLFLCSFLIGNTIKNSVNKKLNTALIQYYVIGTFCVAFQVFIQRMYIMVTGRIVGHYIVMGQGRVAYGGIMGDYSFATLYIASGCLLILLRYLNTKQVNLTTFLIYEIILLGAMITISSRTGLVALVITVLLYLLFNFRRLSSRTMLVLFLGAISLPFIVNQIMASRGGQALLETSGRTENYVQALEYWSRKPFFGYGLGLDNLVSATQLGVPHNFFVQYLLQIGVIGVILLLIPIVLFIRKEIIGGNNLKWMFWIIVIGSMFIPDIVSSRFLYGVVLLCMTSKKNINYS